MTEKCKAKRTQGSDPSTDSAVPPPRSRIALHGIRDAARETARTYRDARRGLMSWNDAAKASFVLTSFAKLVADGELEHRLDALERAYEEDDRRPGIAY